MITIMRKSIQQHVRKLILKKSLILLCIAFVLAIFCHFSSTNEIIIARGHSPLMYILGSVVLLLVILIFIAYKIRLFHNIFGKGWTGTVIKANTSNINTLYSKNSIRNINLFVVVVQLDNSKRKKKLSFKLDKISPKIYQVGDKIELLKGTRYPINLSREVEQHICPFCARNSLYGDYCQNCNLRY